MSRVKTKFINVEYLFTESSDQKLHNSYGTVQVGTAERGQNVAPETAGQVLYCISSVIFCIVIHVAVRQCCSNH